MNNQLLWDLRERSGCGYSICKDAIEYCRKHSNCSPLAYLIVNYNGVKYGNIDKAIVEETKRLLINPPAYADGTKICEVLNNGMAR